MQRYGPPPSYPNLKIPGLNAPIPEGCSFGYHAGGWGKPPVDETGKPLYGDVFGTADAAYAQQMAPEEIDTTLWGEMESESEEEVSKINCAKPPINRKRREILDTVLRPKDLCTFILNRI